MQGMSRGEERKMKNLGGKPPTAPASAGVQYPDKKYLINACILQVEGKHIFYGILFFYKIPHWDLDKCS